MTDLELERGTVVSWLGNYGFIHADASSSDIFVHVSGLCDGLTELQPGRRVLFIAVPDKNLYRVKAANCRYEAAQ